MSDPVAIALITSAGFVLSSSVSAVVLVIVKRLDNRVKIVDNRVEDVAIKVDGRLSELIALTKKSSHAEGVKDEREKNGG